MVFSKSFKWLKISTATVAILLATGFTSLSQSIFPKLKNHVPISEKLHTCGSIDEDTLDKLHKEGVQTIISLSTESPSQITLHKQKASSLGLNYVHIPVSWKRPTMSSLETFFTAMDNHSQTHLLIHCRLNWRASAFVYLYRTIRLMEEESTARAAMLEVCNPDRNRVWSAFIKEVRANFN